jgi:hypothetical protein
MNRYLPNVILGGLAALVLAVGVACSGGAPGAPYPSLSGISSGSLPATGSETITMPQATGLGVGTVTVTGTGTVSATQSVSNPSGVPVLATKQRDTSTGSAPDTASSNTPIAYVTVTASTTASLSIVALKITPTATIPSGTYYVAFWNGAQWVTVGKAATISGGVVSVSTGNLNPAVSLASGASYYLAVYTGEIFTTPTPPPPSPVAAPTALALSVGQSGQVTITSAPQVTITAVSSNTSVATVTASASTGTGTTATFTVTSVAVGTATITFTDPINQKTTVSVSVNNNSPTPEPSPQAATIGLSDVVAVTVNADPNTLITATSTIASVAAISATDAASTSGTATATTSGTGYATFYVTGVAGGSTTIQFSDPSTPPNVGTMNVTVSGIKNGEFTNGLTGWSPCSYAHTYLTALVNPSPSPASALPTQSPAANTTAEPQATAAAMVSVVTPPINDRVNYANPPPGVSATAPPILGTDAAFMGSATSTQRGEIGICQTFTVPEAAPNLSFWVWEGGAEYTSKYADQNAEILNGSAAIDETLFQEENCFQDTSQTLAGLGPTTGNTNGCDPSDDTHDYGDWVNGGYWVQRGPYDLSAYAGQSVTLYVGTYWYYSDVPPSYTDYAELMFLGDVQLVPSSTFPTTAPLNAHRSTLTISLPHRATAIQSTIRKP